MTVALPRLAAGTAALLTAAAGVGLIGLGNPMPVAAAAAAAVSVLAWRHPSLSIVVWLIAVTFTPYWLAVAPMGIALPAPVLMLAPVLVGIAFAPAFRSFQIALPDVLVGLLVASSALSAVAFGGDPSAALSVVMLWLAPYVLGRTAVNRMSPVVIRRTLVALGVACAIWSVIEYATGWHPYVGIRGAVEALNIWSEPQTRGGHVRSMGPFGNTIALSGFLVLVTPYLLRTKRPLLGLLVMAAGVSATFSRSGFVFLGTATLLAIWSGTTKRRTSAAVLALAAVVAWFGEGLLYGVSGPDGREVEWSTEYRKDLWREGFAAIQLIGRSRTEFPSVDNQYLRTGLELGWIPLGFLILLALFLIGRVVARGAIEPGAQGAAAVALMWLTVAALTQWQVLTWFAIGTVAVGAAQSSRREASRDTPSERAGAEVGRPAEAVHQPAPHVANA